MKKVLFLDRDGTLIREPEDDCQVDSLEKLEFIPGVFRNLYKIRHFTNFQLIIVTNQDGLGTELFPEKDFQPAQEKFLQAFRNEGVEFDAIHIDPSLPEEGSPGRKPGTGMLGAYLQEGYDMSESYVIGDRVTDMELARNLGAKGILFGQEKIVPELISRGLEEHTVLVSDNWDVIYRYIRASQRRSSVVRKTGETEVTVNLALDGEGSTRIHTGLGFLDHMLDQLGRHGGLDLEVEVKGDLHVDEHHTVEDCALTLGQAMREALGDKRGIDRYGFVLPMDDAGARVSIDFGGRPWVEWEADFRREKIGDVPTEMFFHFFKSFSDEARCNLHIRANGANEHHKIEAIFKAFARSIKAAVRLDPDLHALPTTKGKL